MVRLSRIFLALLCLTRYLSVKFAVLNSYLEKNVADGPWLMHYIRQFHKNSFPRQPLSAFAHFGKARLQRSGPVSVSGVISIS